MVRLILVDENLILLQIHLAVNFDLDLSTISFFFLFFQSNSEVECALNVIVSIYRAILNFSDFQYIFCKACGKAGLVRECFELLRRLKTCTHELSDKWVSRQ